MRSFIFKAIVICIILDVKAATCDVVGGIRVKVVAIQNSSLAEELLQVVKDSCIEEPEYIVVRPEAHMEQESKALVRAHSPAFAIVCAKKRCSLPIVDPKELLAYFKKIEG